jgi:hypothetical protein
MTLGLLGTIVLLGLLGWFAHREQGQRYEQIVRILERQRDEARQEAKVFRNLLFPVMAKAESGASGDVSSAAATPVAAARQAPPSASPKAPELPKTVADIWKMKVPYRQKFKLYQQLTNSKQQRTDALASALEKQKPAQEKTHVAV